MRPLILDSEAISRLARTTKKSPEGIVHQWVRAATISESPILVPAAVLAEQYRGNSHDQLLDSCLSRYPGIEIVDTTRSLARSIGNTLGKAKAGSAHHVDATIIAVALTCGGGVILTSDPYDLQRLASSYPAITIVPIND